MDIVSSLTSDIVGKSLDGLAMRHTAIATNLANVDTPGYRRRDVRFEQALQAALGKNTPSPDKPGELAMKVSTPGHISNISSAGDIQGLQPEILEDERNIFRIDGNSVDIEREMAELARNTERYTALANIAGRRMRGLKSVISGSGEV